ncbi:hypothetical protein MVEN_00592400 [Mycena venus]|uniref:DUF7330 domain-containing protein n=1 Tax=Mycena venus TaxID=2733690 RepID=A0A8H6YJN8_9AGAR|nr:hypothetical protein MVEN_00592400 [Mycena venus]
MIITDNTPQSPVKDSSQTTPLLGDASGSNPPPAYSTPPPTQAGPTPIGNTYAAYQPVYTPGQLRLGESAGQRFCKAFLVAFGVWILASALLGSITASGAFEDYGPYPIPGDVETNHCVTAWSGDIKNPTFPFFPYSAATSFEFSLPSKTLVLLHKGGISNGHLKIRSSSEVTDKVRVNVKVNYYKAAVRDTAQVCLIERSKGESGVGIFTPKPWRSPPSTDRLSFDVELILPRAKSVLNINALSTDVNNFSHDIDSLDGFYFNNLSLTVSNGEIQAAYLGSEKIALTTSNGNVAVDSLVAPVATLRSTNGGVSGTYAVVDSLDLQTSNGVVDVAVTFTGGRSHKSTKELTLHTTNNALNYIVNLGAASDKTGAFRVKADTSNGKLTGEIVSAPLNSVLAIDTSTTNSQASLTLPSTYEGGFQVATSNAPVLVKRVDLNEQDPACDYKQNCKGRTRSFKTTTVTKRSVTGYVHWDKKNANRGKVSLTSSNGATTLYV